MKVKIVEPGWDNFSGNFGGVQFEDCVSVDDVTPREAAVLGNIIRVETLEGVNPSSSQTNLDSKCTPMAVIAESAMITPAVAPVVAKKTRAELEAIADASGIKGLREIGDVLGVKASAILDLINLILEAQGSDLATQVKIDGPSGPDTTTKAETVVKPVIEKPEGSAEGDGSQESAGAGEGAGEGSGAGEGADASKDAA